MHTLLEVVVLYIERFKCFKHLLTPILLNTMSSYQKAQDWISISYCFTIMLEESYEKPFLSFFTVIVLSSSSFVSSSSSLQLLTGSFPFPFVFFRPTCHSSLKELLEGKHQSLFVTHIPLLTFPEIRVKGAAPPPGRHPSAPPPSPPPPSPPPPCFLLFRTLWPGRGSPPRRLPRPPCQLWQGSAKEGQT